MALKSAWRAAADAALAGGPLPLDELLRLMIPYVPYGRAVRTRSQVYAATAGRKRPGGEYRPRDCDPMDEFATGARLICTDAITNAVRNGTFVRLPDGMIGLRERMPRAAP